ncbi:MAG: MBL fold metallo-hydrolase [Syntrophomonadaceae bacterium]
MVAQRILPGLYRIEVPLPGNPLKATNSYVFTSRKRNLIVDTGLNRPECLQTMRSSLGELGVELNQTDFFITHMHADHVGLVPAIALGRSQIYCSRPEAEFINDFGLSSQQWDFIMKYARVNGYPDSELEEPIKTNPGVKGIPGQTIDFTIVGEGDVIKVGDYRLVCIETPGHSQGHLCLYETNKKLLISGDHILDKITPTVSQWSLNGNHLREYLASLNKVQALDVSLTLPGHRNLITDCRRRISELKAHHQFRLQEILSLLTARQGQTAYHIASRMSWDLSYTEWEQFPRIQRFFATGEALSHLVYLVIKGKVRAEEVNGITFFYLAAKEIDLQGNDS